jgi:hypothetical protein
MFKKSQVIKCELYIIMDSKRRMRNTERCVNYTLLIIRQSMLSDKIEQKFDKIQEVELEKIGSES